MKFHCADPKPCVNCVRCASYPQKFARFAWIRKSKIELQATVHATFARFAGFARANPKNVNFDTPLLLKGA